MDVVIRGKNVKVSKSLRTAAEEHLAKLDRYANGFARAEVDFSEERNPRIADNQRCEVLVHVKGHLLKAHASAPEPFAALYAVCDKVEHQVKRAGRVQTRAATNTSNSTASSWPRLTSLARMSSARSMGMAFL